MKTIKNALIIFLLTAGSSAVKAQNVGYTYDAAGNRIKREIVMSRQQAPTRSANASEEEESYSEMLAKKKITIFPNPTSGRLKVEVLGLGDEDKCQLRLFNSAGAQIISEQTATATTTLDISSRPNGIYILCISINGEDTSWKIIKK